MSSGERLWEIEERYRGRFEVVPLSFGTVRDWADSVDQFDGLAKASFDMKNLQRCWMVKAILGTVRPGGRLLEIGAGEPLVAGLLNRLGYGVTVVDAYDGSGHGPRDFEEFRSSHPDLSFIRERFPPRAGLDGAYEAVYSISVLEHVPIPDIDAVIDGARELLAPGGISIHAIDHVLAGWGADEHRERLDRIVRGSGLSTEALDELLDRAATDPETYLVSADAHQRWRGDLPYDQYPMRRIASINVAERRDTHDVD